MFNGLNNRIYSDNRKENKQNVQEREHSTISTNFINVMKFRLDKPKGESAVTPALQSLSQPGQLSPP